MTYIINEHLKLNIDFKKTRHIAFHTQNRNKEAGIQIYPQKLQSSSQQGSSDESIRCKRKGEADKIVQLFKIIGHAWTNLFYFWENI